MIDFKFTHSLNEEILKIKDEIFNEEKPYQPNNEKTPWHLMIYFKNIPIGVASFLEIDPETFEVFDIGVKKEYRNHKIGSYMLKFIGTKVRELGGRKLLVHSTLDMKNFFSKNSFITKDDGEMQEINGLYYIEMLNSLVKKKRYSTYH